MSVVHVKINGIPVEVEAGSSVLAAATAAGVKIPTLCYHEDIKPTASCGLCIVKMEGSPKIQRACASPVQEGASYITDDPELFQARKTVIELILSTHPADCLTCIRNQNCELQKLAADFGIREIPFDARVKRLPKDESSPSIILEPTKCIKCGRCVEVCQDLQGVYALEYVGRGDGSQMQPACNLPLNDSPCVKCGQCAAHCPVGAIYERDDTELVRQAINDPAKTVVVNIAPSVRVGIGEEFGMGDGALTVGKLYTGLRQLGFDKVFDTNFAADLTIMEEGSELVHRLTHGGVLPQLTSCCPAWTDYMEKYYPDMIPNFSSAKSPMQMQGPITKTYWAQKAGIDPATIVNVAVMPCTAKKFEIGRDENMSASGYKDTDISITTRELARMFKAKGIDLSVLPESDVDDPIGEYSGAGTIFGNTGGVMEAAIRTAYWAVTGKELEGVDVDAVRGPEGIKTATIKAGDLDLKVAIVSGLGNVKTVLEEVRKARAEGKEPPYHFIEVMACKGGCISGGGQPYASSTPNRAARTAGLYADDKRSAVRCSHQNPSIKKIYDEFLGAPLSEKSEELLHTKYHQRPIYQ
ncbi:MAG: iron hydrogenase small subunit [Spirochaetales bacterium]|nr:iron hydrogenase small subunit [Spirochaetales bacterium]